MSRSSRSRARGLGSASLAGWLFADLALLLAFAFLDSSAKGLSGASSAPTTTVSPSTSVAGNATNQGVRPKPIEIEVRYSDSASLLIERIDDALRSEESTSDGRRKFLVVLVYTGVNGDNREVAQSRAKAVADTLESEWNRVVKGQTYFVALIDFSKPADVLALKLFPVQS